VVGGGCVFHGSPDVIVLLYERPQQLGVDLEQVSSLAELMQSDRYRFANRGYAEENTGSSLCFDARPDGCAYYELYKREPEFK
jgi:hypothetical protein